MFSANRTFGFYAFLYCLSAVEGLPAKFDRADLKDWLRGLRLPVCADPPVWWLRRWEGKEREVTN